MSLFKSIFGGSDNKTTSTQSSGAPSWAVPYFQDMLSRGQSLSQSWPTIPGADQTVAGPSGWWGAGENLANNFFGPGLNQLGADSQFAKALTYQNSMAAAPGLQYVTPTTQAPGVTGGDLIGAAMDTMSINVPGFNGQAEAATFIPGSKANGGTPFSMNSAMPGAGGLPGMAFNKDFNTYGLDSHLDPSDKGNPYLNSVISNVQSDINRNLRENILPGIGREAQSAGQYGGTRQGIAEGIAARGAAEEAAQQAANLRFQDYTNANNRAIQAGGMLGDLDLGSQSQAANRANIMGNYNIAGADLNNRAAGQQFNNALAGWNANEGQRQFNANFGEGQRQFDNPFMEMLRQNNFNMNDRSWQNNFNAANANFQNRMNAFNSLFDATNRTENNAFNQALAANNQYFNQGMQGAQFGQGVYNDTIRNLAGINNNFLNQIPAIQGIGDPNRNYQQQYLDANTQANMFNAMGPYNALNFYASLLQGVPNESNSFSRSKGSSTPGLSGFLGGVLS